MGTRSDEESGLLASQKDHHRHHPEDSDEEATEVRASFLAAVQIAQEQHLHLSALQEDMEGSLRLLLLYGFFKTATAAELRRRRPVDSRLEDSSTSKEEVEIEV